MFKTQKALAGDDVAQLVRLSIHTTLGLCPSIAKAKHATNTTKEVETGGSVQDYPPTSNEFKANLSHVPGIEHSKRDEMGLLACHT